MGNIGKAALIAAAGLSSATPAAAQSSSEVLLVKPGLTMDQKVQEFAQCRTTADNIRQSGPSYVVRPIDPATGRIDTSAGAAVGSVVGQLIGDSIVTSNLRNAYYKSCIEGRGYRPAHLTPEDAAAYRRLRNDEDRKAWEAAFFASPRFERAASALTPPLPDAEADNFVLGGVRLTPGTLTLLEGGRLSQVGQVAARAQARLLGSGVLAEGFKYGGMEFARGTTFHEVSSRNAGNHIVATAWCGLATKGGSVCLVNDYDGYAVLADRTGSQAPLFFDGVSPKARLTSPVAIEELRTSEAAYQLEFRLARLDRKMVEMDVHAVGEGQDYVVHKVKAWFDQSGSASTFVAGYSLAFAIDPTQKSLVAVASILDVQKEAKSPPAP